MYIVAHGDEFAGIDQHRSKNVEMFIEMSTQPCTNQYLVSKFSDGHS